MVTIDGSRGDGGGSVVRTALAVATLTQQAIRIERIRTDARQPGIDLEDLVIADLLARSCNAEVEGELRTSVLEFRPRSRPQGVKATIPRFPPPGLRQPSAVLAVATVLPVLHRAETMSDFNVSGETHGRNSLSFQALDQGVLPALSEIGYFSEVNLDLAGFGRESSGKLSVYAEPGGSKPLAWDTRGPEVEISMHVETGQLPASMAQRAVQYAERLAASSGVEIECHHHDVESRGPGYHITFVADFTKGRVLGQAAGSKNVKIEESVSWAFQEMMNALKTDATTDSYLADHLLVPMCFSGQGGTFTVPHLTSRLLGIVWTIKQLSPARIVVKGKEGEPGTITVY